MAITPRQLICPTSKWDIKCPYTMAAEYITVHNTANDASAQNEITYMNSNNNQVSFHFAIDNKEVVQGIPLNRNAWHAGDGGNGPGNRKTIGIEICYSLSGGVNFVKAEKLAAQFIAQLLDERGWGTDRVKRHQDWSGKYCPHRTLDMGWSRFIGMIESELKVLKDAKNPPVVWINQDKKSYICIVDTNLVNIKTGEKVRAFASGVGLDFVQHCTYNGKAYYRTQYSKDNNIDNGIPVLDVVEVEIPEEKIVWDSLHESLSLVALRDCHKINLKTGEIIESYELGSEVTDLVDDVFWNGSRYFRTKADRDAKKDYGIEAYQLEEKADPPITDIDKIPDEKLEQVIGKPSNEPPIAGDENAPNWFIQFITAIADFVKQFFGKY